MEFDQRIGWVIRVVAVGLTLLWGGLAPLVQILVFLIIFDFLTGMLAAYVTKELSSNIGFVGAAKKAMILIVVAAAFVVEPQAGGVPIGNLIAGFFAANELLSITENAAEAGLPVPKALVQALAKFSAQATEK